MLILFDDMAKYAIDIQKKYSMPAEISIQHISDSILIIAPETANWIVLSSSVELDVFNFLRQHCIGDAICKFDVDEVRKVVVQLEARRFCNKKIKSATEVFKHMHLYLTNSCNLRCPHCYMFSGRANANELTTAEILKLLSDFRESGGRNVTFSGGEPTIRSDFDELLKNAFNMGLKVRVLTNGILWTTDRIEALSPMLDSVQISIDGYSERTNSGIRGDGHFIKALKTVDGLTNAGVNVSVAITPPYELLKHNLEEYAAFAFNLSESYKDRGILIKFSEGLLNGRDECPTKYENEDYFKLISKLRQRLHGDNYEVISFAQAVNHDIIMDNCMFGVFTISSNGDVYMCARTSDLKPVANVRTHSFGLIVELSKTAEMASQTNRLRPCKDCDLRYICGGGCRIDEFPKLTGRESFNNVDYTEIPARKCNFDMKAKFYALMIKSNPYLYKPL